MFYTIRTILLFGFCNLAFAQNDPGEEGSAMNNDGEPCEDEGSKEGSGGCEDGSDYDDNNEPCPRSCEDGAETDSNGEPCIKVNDCECNGDILKDGNSGK